MPYYRKMQNKASEKPSATDKPDTRKQGLPDGPYPRRRGRKSTAKNYESSTLSNNMREKNEVIRFEQPTT